MDKHLSPLTEGAERSCEHAELATAQAATAVLKLQEAAEIVGKGSKTMPEFLIEALTVMQNDDKETMPAVIINQERGQGTLGRQGEEGQCVPKVVEGKAIAAIDVGHTDGSR